jgi:carbon starvation protein
MGIPFLTVAVVGSLGAFMVNQFILTSVDTSTRISRFIISENLMEKLKNKSKWKNRFFLTIIVLIPAWLLAVTNSYETLWKLFGASNQLIAAIALIAVAAYFMARKKKVKFMIIPALLILVTTLSALIYLTFRAGGYITEGNWALVIISLILFIFGLIVSVEGFKKLLKKR